MKKMKLNNKGFSLLELLLVVAVGAVLLLSGLAVYQNVTNNSKINDSTRLLNVLKQETQRLFQGEGTYPSGTDLTPILINADVVPSSNVRGTDITHPFNGNVTLEGAGGTFTMTYAGMPKAACVKLGQLYGMSDPDFENLAVGTTDADTDDDGIIEVTELDTACDDENDMVWTFF